MIIIVYNSFPKKKGSFEDLHTSFLGAITTWQGLNLWNLIRLTALLTCLLFALQKSSQYTKDAVDLFHDEKIKVCLLIL